MEKPRLLLVVGTRPEVIKMAPLYFALREKENIDTRLVAAGQHTDMLESALAAFALSADIRFAVEGGGLAESTASLLARSDTVLEKEAPTAVAVHGDTATAFAAALAAFYRGIPVFHVEAGLRTGDILSPFPEELYRVSIDRLASLCFAPTAEAVAALEKEGIGKGKIHLSGNTGIDALRYTVRKDFSHPLLSAAEGKRLVLLTCHRRESLSALSEICEGVKAGLRGRRDILLLFPMHPNPLVERAARPVLDKTAGVLLLPPLDTLVFHNLLSRAHLVLTDSGGIEEETTALGIPTLVLRERTERPEGVAAGVLFPVGTKREKIAAALDSFLEKLPPSRPSVVYGDGYASGRIAAEMEKFLCK